jgi:amino acid adenylation domain-containing protein
MNDTVPPTIDVSLLDGIRVPQKITLKGPASVPVLLPSESQSSKSHLAIVPPPTSDSPPYPLSPMQSGMLYQALLDDPAAPANGYDLEQMHMVLDETLDADKFRRAFTLIVERHPILSSAFSWDDVAQPTQRPFPVETIPLTVEDWSTATPAERHERFQALLVRDRAHGFDLRQPPLMRLVILKCGDHDEVLWSFHHILLDGRSFPILLTEVFHAYEALREGRPVALGPAPRPYGDYARWVSSIDVEKSRPFFRTLLRGKTTPTPLPCAESAARPLPEKGHGEASRTVDGAVLDRARQAAKRSESSLGTVVQAALGIVLARFTGDDDVVFGALRACRRSALAGDAQAMVGLFINTLPVRARTDDARSIAELLADLRTQSLAMREYEHTSLTEIQGQSEIPRGLPLFETLLMFENQELNEMLVAAGGPRFRSRHFKVHEQPAVPLAINVYAGETMEIRALYDRRRFRTSVIERLLASLEKTIDELGGDLARPLGAIDVLPAAERQRIVYAWNETTRAFPENACIHSLFEERVREQPDAVALEVGDESLTFAALEERANRLANYLRQRGARPGLYVGICLDRGFDLVTAMLAVAKSGAAYLPLDPTYPQDRLQFMVDDAHALLVLTERKYQDLFASHAHVAVDGEDRVAIAQSAPERPARVGAPSDVCYTIFTSGSTGKPKGVVLTHRAVVNTFDWVSRTFRVGRGDRLLFVTSPCFDLSVYDTFGALGAGATVVIATQAMLKDPTALVSELVRKRITIWDSAPAALARLVPLFPAPSQSPTLRLTMLSGDWIPLTLPDAVRHAFPGCEVMSLGGATEAAIWSNWFPIGAIDPRWTSIPYGRPIQNARYHVLDRRLQPVPVGVSGDLYIGGECLAQGYLNRPGLTRERFIPDPLSSAGGRLYKTGDLARYFESGDLEFLGRADFQVKIRGFRVELGEVEAALLAQPGVREASCMAHPDPSGQRSLVAYLVAEKGTTLDEDSLRNALGRSLPDFMLPSHFIFLDGMPVSANGKLDRKALPNPTMRSNRVAFVAPKTPQEIAMVQIFEEVLEKKPLGIADDFFANGGHSLLAVTLMSKIKSALGLDLRLSLLLEYPTVEKLLSAIAQPSADPTSCLLELRPGDDKRCLFLIHDGDGETLLYRTLAGLIPRNIPVYGVKPLGRGRLPMVHASVEDMARYYLQEIRGRQPEGPYFLGGLCAGGVIAYEVAYQLERAGEDVFVGLVEAAPPNAKKRALRITRQRWRRVAELVPTLGRDARAVLGKLRDKLVNMATYESLHQSKRLRGRLLFEVLRHGRFADGQTWPEWLPPLTVREIYLAAVRHYQPRPSQRVRAVVFSATEHGGDEPPFRELLVDPDLGWHALLGDRVTLVDAPGGHSNILQQPHVATVAPYFSAAFSGH